VTWFSSCNGYAYVKGGRWWLYFGCLSVALNDSCAYFAGKCFGKHHLIGLSPNKTIEGFVGGLIGNLCVTYYMANRCLGDSFWACAPENLNYKMFEDFTCKETLSIYNQTEYKLPITFMGY